MLKYADSHYHSNLLLLFILLVNFFKVVSSVFEFVAKHKKNFDK